MTLEEFFEVLDDTITVGVVDKTNSKRTSCRSNSERDELIRLIPTATVVYIEYAIDWNDLNVYVEL